MLGAACLARQRTRLGASATGLADDAPSTFPTGIERMDRAGLQNSAALAAVVARHPQVERILCGHLHRAIDRRFAGTVAGTAPSTAAQLRLSLTPGAPLRFMFEPPGYQLHLWCEDSGLVTHTAVFGEWPDPHPLRAAS